MAPTTPIINKPHGSGTGTTVQYSTNISTQIVTGIADSDTKYVKQNSNLTGITFIPYPLDGSPIDSTHGTWSLTISTDPIVVSGANVFSIQAEGYDGSLSVAATLTIYLLEDGSLDVIVDAPTGISMDRYTDRIKFRVTHTENVQSATPSTLVTGFNFYASTLPGGGLNGYTLLNTSLVTDYDEVVEETISESSTTDRTTSGDSITQVVTTTSNIEQQYKYAYNHVRSNDADASDYPQRDEAYTIFNAITDTQELYYVATAVAYDATANVEYESTYTSELVGLPLVLSTRIKDMTPRTLNNIQQDLISEILRVQSNIDIRPGSVTRDIHIDPPAWEANRIWLILDFVSRCQSFLTLIQIDDPYKTGTSIAYAESKYKQALAKALSLTESEVQILIDEAFEKKAADSLTIRQGNTKSVGQAIFQRSTAPTQDLSVIAGTTVQSRVDTSTNTSAVSFVTTITKTMSVASIGSYYNPTTGYYELTIPIEAVTAGSAGNVAAGSIVSTSASGFSRVTNREATLLGQDEESNLSLAERAMLAYVSVDRGTSGGYLRTALDVVGVHRARVVEAGEDLMMRDWDDIREKHIGGKVDLWIQGTALTEIEETFAFTYTQELNVRFTAVGEASNLIFRTTSINVTVSTPIFALLDDATLGYGFRNASTGEDFDLTDVSIIDYRTIQLDNTRPQPTVDEDDIVIGDYKYRDSEPFVPSTQPVVSISSIASPTSTLTTVNYSLKKSEDPLLYGYSVEASDEINIVQSGGIPTGDTTTVTDEEIVLIGSTHISLASVGIDITSIVVTNTAGTVTYESDLGSAVTPDYFLVAGSLTTAPTIARNESGDILNGEKVLVSYTCEENFTVTYAVNNVLQLVDADVQVMRHVTADVLVKQSIENEIELSCTVVLEEDADQVDVDKQIRTGLSYLINRLEIGEDLHQSDVVHTIKDVLGVSYVVQPMTKMHKSDGSLILRDLIDSDATQIVTGIAADVWILHQELSFSTSIGGGTEDEHRGVFKDDQSMTLYSLAGDFNQLKTVPYSALIIGADGIDITGYTTPETQVALTANRVCVSLPKGYTPERYIWTVSYIVDGESGVCDIEAFIMEYLTLGEVVITYTTSSDTYGNNF